jgi:predicted nucleotidyltransferase
LLGRLCLWTEARADIRAVIVVGSFARGDARPDSDLDVLLLAKNPSAYLEDSSWVSALGNVLDVGVERYGRVTSLRVHFDCGLEVELGIAPADWASEPYDAGTTQVALGGIRVLVDQDGEVTALAATDLDDLRESSSRADGRTSS